MRPLDLTIDGFAMKVQPPEILLPCARQSHDIKCLAGGHARRFVPHSPMSLRASEEPRPWICVKSLPVSPYRAARTSKDGAFVWLVFVRIFGSGASGASNSRVMEAIATSSLRSHSNIFTW